MSANNNKDKKNKPLSASSLCKIASKNATRTQTADKASSSNKTIRTTDPDPNTSSDKHIMLSDNLNALTEGYNITTLLYSCIRLQDDFSQVVNFTDIIVKNVLLTGLADDDVHKEILNFI